MKEEREENEERKELEGAKEPSSLLFQSKFSLEEKWTEHRRLKGTEAIQEQHVTPA